MEYIVKEISGRFEHLKETTLRRMKLELKAILTSWGATWPEDLGNELITGQMPLWAEVEFLDNIVKFELECNPFLKGEILN